MKSYTSLFTRKDHTGLLSPSKEYMVNRGSLIPLYSLMKGEKIMSMTLEQIIAMAKAIGMELNSNHPITSHDPFLGYDPLLLIKIVGEKAVKEIESSYNSALLEGLSDSFSSLSLDEIVAGRYPLISTRGKSKGFEGLAVRHMPSKFNDKDNTFILYNPFKSEEVFCNTKSCKVRPYRKGETYTLRDHIEVGKSSSLVRGQQVYIEGKVGVVVAKPAQRNGSHLYSVGVQWQGEAMESWTFPHLLRLQP